MAKIQFGAIVTGARGRVGGQVFTINSSGAQLAQGTKTTTKKGNPKRARQNATVGGSARAWRTLGDSVRQAFIDAAPSYPRQNSLGQTYYLTGYQFYQALNTAVQAAGGNALSTFKDPAAPGFTVGQLTVNSVDIVVSSGITFDTSYSGDPSNVVVKVFASRPVSQGKSKLSNQYKLMTVMPIADINDPIPFADYLSLYPGALVDLKAFFKLVVCNEQSGYEIIATDQLGGVIATS